MSSARLQRYMSSAGVGKTDAFQLYIWNVRLCEAFYFPTQLCEVAIRNAIHGALVGKFSESWYERGAFLCTLPNRLRDELQSTIDSERRNYGAKLTLNHVVSGLSLGFWVHLLTKNYEGVLWPQYYAAQFPNKPAHIDRQGVYNMVDKFRTHRNRMSV